MAQAVVQSSCEKLRSALVDESTMRLNFTGNLQEILDQLVALDAVITNAEGWWMAAHNEDADHDDGQEWQTKVRDTAYRVCHMMDELQETTITKMLGHPENSIIDPKSKEIMLDKMKEITEKLKELHNESATFTDAADRTALLQAPEAVVGRGADLRRILAQLSACRSSGEKGPIILLISGEHLNGAVGRATMAALVFDHNRFKCYSRVWINHSRMLKLHEIGKHIISQLVPGAGEEEISGAHVSDDDMGYIKNRLHKLLNGKKVLIVLHNLWENGSDWKRLKDMLSGLMDGTEVIVIATTAEDHMAMEIFGVEPYCLDPLSENMCCRIVKQVAIRSQDHTSAEEEELEQIAPQVAKLCKGLPLAARLYGAVLQLKPYAEWPEQDFAHSPIQLIFTYMSPNMRSCFDYCAFLFLREREIVKEDLIHQWIALDLIEPSETISTPQLAEQYLRRLLDMSLLQNAKSSQRSAKDDTCAISFTMHQSVHKFTLKFMNGRFRMEQEERRYYYYTQHFSYALLSNQNDTELKSMFPDKIRVLRCSGCSKMNLSDDSFSFARDMRVLELHDESSLQKPPASICQLRHLGYLKLSGWSTLVTLPESIGDLINLLHIDLSSCSGLVNLPGSFGKLKNLVHVSLSGCSKLENLPESFRKLIKLVYIDLSGSALVNLPEFFGKLTNLVHINLSGCLTLANLPRAFGKLKKLEHMNLSGCPRLVNLPGSVGKLTNLVRINLSGCNGLVNLPDSFGELRSLVHINLSGCYGLEELPQSFGKLISLVHVNLSSCSGLATLPGSFGALNNLLHIDLSRCYGLSKLPESFGKLTKLVHLDLSFWSCFEGIHTALEGLTNLQHLNLSHPCSYRANYQLLKGLKEVLSKFTRVKHLSLSMFLNPIFCNQSEVENCEYIKFISGFSRLEYLDLSHNIFLRDIPQSISDLDRIHTLDLSGCIRLKKVGQWMNRIESLETVVLSNLESYQFVVGVDNAINNYGQLVDVRCNELELTCLEKMKSVAEPRRIRLADKQYLQKLKLCWTVNSQRSMEDNALLRELVPPHSLQYLALHGYSSTCFPSWLTSSKFSFNLVEVTMEDIPRCSHLPPLGLLPNLQRVALRKMGSITRIDAGELSGGNAEAFNRLSEFTMIDLGSLEAFITTYYSGGEELVFSTIDKLVVQRCPNLSFVPVPPRAQRLVISDCSVAMVCWPSTARRHGVEGPSCIPSPVTELLVENCWVYPSNCYLLTHLPGLRSLTIMYSNNLLCSPEIIGVLSSLQTLCFSHCHWMHTLPEQVGGLSSLQELRIESCRQFQWLPESMKQLTSLQSMQFNECNHMTVLPPWLGSFTSLQNLVIKRCLNIATLPQSICDLTNLKDLRIVGCVKLKAWCRWPGNKEIVDLIHPNFEEAPTREQHQQLPAVVQDDSEQSDLDQSGWESD